jgi:ribosomal protein L22
MAIQERKESANEIQDDIKMQEQNKLVEAGLNKEKQMAEEIKKEDKLEEKKMEEKSEKKAEEKKEDKSEKKKIEVKKVKKDYAIVNGLNLNMSTKEAADICNMIRGKNIDDAIKMVEEVIDFKRPVRMNKREASHQHGIGVMAGGFPINACKYFLMLLKGLRANAIYHELELEKVIIFCKADQAARPYRRGGRRFRRSHVLIKLIKKQDKNTKNIKENKK